jgi:cytochrome c oxidase subunit 2
MIKRLWSVVATAMTLPFVSLSAFAATDPFKNVVDSNLKLTDVGATLPDPAAHWDELWHELMTDIYAIGVVYTIIAVYAVLKFTRKTPDQVGTGVKLTPIESIAWAAIPAFCFMADDFYLAAKGWSLFNDQRRVPANHMEVKLTGEMWGWNYMYPEACNDDGDCVEAYNELRVPVGTAILLRMTSSDVVHSHYIPDMRIKEDLMPGRVTYIWFNPTAPGEHVITCNEYCGAMHSGMVGNVIAMPKAEFDAWLAEEKSSL